MDSLSRKNHQGVNEPRHAISSYSLHLLKAKRIFKLFSLMNITLNNYFSAYQ